jgi:ribosomal-protein-alanine N-acetyltransferase
MRVGVRVRVAGAADVAGVVALERAIAEAPHWGKAEYAAMVRGDRAVDGAVRRCFFVAEPEPEPEPETETAADGALLGFAVGKVIGSDAEGSGELESVAVEASARRVGVGRALCAAVVDWCRGQAVKALELEVRAGSEGAIALYAGLGFVVAGRRVGYYREPVEDALLMRLDLRGAEKAGLRGEIR